MSMEWSKAPRRVSYDQMKELVDFMGQHVEFATGVLRTTEARHKCKQLWEQLANNVNCVRGGTNKTPDMWSRYWSDFKNKLKKKVKLINRSKRSGVLHNTKPLTKLEKRVLVILGPKFVKVNSGDRKTNRSFVPMPAEVKVEMDYQDNIEMCKEQSDNSDRPSDDDQDEESEESSPEENGEDTEIEINESSLQNIYPKWLIDIEKKRADAELCRARAEEKRATLAVRNAEAALIQAEALKKLSDAAVTQAEALTRIATCIENRTHLPI